MMEGMMHLRPKSDMSHAHDSFAIISCKPTEICVFCHCFFLLERERDDDTFYAESSTAHWWERGSCSQWWWERCSKRLDSKAKEPAVDLLPEGTTEILHPKVHGPFMGEIDEGMNQNHQIFWWYWARSQSTSNTTEREHHCPPSLE